MRLTQYYVAAEWWQTVNGVLLSLCSGKHLKYKSRNEAPLKTSSLMLASFPLAFVLVKAFS